jgi:hypothetical protein
LGHYPNLDASGEPPVEELAFEAHDEPEAPLTSGKLGTTSSRSNRVAARQQGHYSGIVKL